MEIWTATLTKTVSSASERLEELLKRLATRGDDYEKVSINVQALSEEKRATFCDELINCFVNAMPSLEKMTPNVEFDFDKPRPQWPTNLEVLYGKSATNQDKTDNQHKFLKWNLKNQCSGECFTLSISTNTLQSEVHTMCIQVDALDRGNKIRCRRHPSSSTEIGDIPAGLLGRALIQHLPWRKRVQVEGVCRRWQREALTHGWADVNELSVLDLRRLHPRNNEPRFEGRERSINFPLLLPMVISRAGPHLTTLDLEIFGKELSEAMLRATLAECPQLRHLRMGWWQLIRIPNFLRELLCADGVTWGASSSSSSSSSPKLKSLSLRSSHWRVTAEEMQGAAMFIQTLNPHSLPQLEHLRMSAWGLEVRQLPPALRFPPHCQLVNLRHLELVHCQDIFDVQSLGQLPTLCPALRSLTLNQFTRWDLSFLGHFSQLEHLKINLWEENLPSFNAALLHLGGTLKALEVWGRLNHSGYTLITPAIAFRLPKLEHLGLRVEKTWDEKKDEEVRKLLSSLASLESLRSLFLDSPCRVDWGWLVGICHRLEYLNLWEKEPVPLTTIYDIVRNGKSLRYLVLAHQWNAASLAVLVEAAAAAAAAAAVTSASSEGDERRGKGASKSVALPTLKIIANIFYSSAESEPAENAMIKGSRVRFVPRMPESHVLAEYRDGCLSEPPQR